MRLTPAEVHNVAFKKPSIGKRGYDEDEVDAFLDLVEDELARLIEENNELTARLGGTSAVSSAATSDEKTPAADTADTAETAAAVPAAESDGDVEAAVETSTPVTPVSSGDAHVHAARLLGLAQETADRLTAEAKAESEQLLADAKAESERVRTEAQTYSDDLLTEAHAKADTAEQDAQRKSDEVLSGLAEERVGLEKKIDDLRTYEREYRSRLKTWITDQLQALDGNNSESSTVS